MRQERKLKPISATLCYLSIIKQSDEEDSTDASSTSIPRILGPRRARSAARATIRHVSHHIQVCFLN